MQWQCYLLDQIEMGRIFQLFSVGREEKDPSDLNTIDYHPLYIYKNIIISEGLLVFNINILMNNEKNYYSSFGRIISSTRCYLVFLYYGRFQT